MKPAYFITVLITAFFLFSIGGVQAQDKNDKTTRPYLGVKLDPNPLPDLLAIHFNLDPDKGLVIQNIQQDSPADKAGLEKDDILLRFKDRDVTSYSQFVEDIRSSGIGKEVQLEILHRGQRQKISLTLEAYQETIRWKYPFERPTLSQPYRPGRMFRLDPDSDRWQQIPFPDLPQQNDYLKHYLGQSTHYEFRTKSADGKTDLTIIINGDPNDDDATITVKTDQKEITTTVGDVDDLPEDYRAIVKDYLDQARESSDLHPFQLPGFRIPPPGNFNYDWPPKWNIAPNDYAERLEQLEKHQDHLRQQMINVMKKLNMIKENEDAK